VLAWSHRHPECTLGVRGGDRFRGSLVAGTVELTETAAHFGPGGCWRVVANSRRRTHGSADWSCSHNGARVDCAAVGARHHDDDHIWLCGADGAQTNCTSTGSVVPPAGGGLWRCEIEHMQFECTQVAVGDRGDDDLGVPRLRADLPYDARPQLGDTYQLSDSFREKGPLPAAVLKVTMEGTPWRVKELQDNTPFVITEQDCSHEGNRDTGRDRAFVTWRNEDGSVETDHIDLRYCKN